MSLLLKLFLVAGILLSIFATYYIMIVRGDFVIFENPDGVPTLEE